MRWWRGHSSGKSSSGDRGGSSGIGYRAAQGVTAPGLLRCRILVAHVLKARGSEELLGRPDHPLRDLGPAIFRPAQQRVAKGLQTARHRRPIPVLNRRQRPPPPVCRRAIRLAAPAAPGRTDPRGSPGLALHATQRDAL